MGVGGPGRVIGPPIAGAGICCQFAAVYTSFLEDRVRLARGFYAPERAAEVFAALLRETPWLAVRYENDRRHSTRTACPELERTPGPNSRRTRSRRWRTPVGWFAGPSTSRAEADPWGQT
jgi:hypothetical protein